MVIKNWHAANFSPRQQPADKSSNRLPMQLLTGRCWGQKLLANTIATLKKEIWQTIRYEKTSMCVRWWNRPSGMAAIAISSINIILLNVGVKLDYLFR